MQRATALSCILICALHLGCGDKTRDQATGPGATATASAPSTPDDLLRARMRALASERSLPAAAPEPGLRRGDGPGALVAEPAAGGWEGVAGTGLGLSGTGDLSGRGEGIGLGDVSTRGGGRLSSRHRPKPPQVRMGATSVSGRLPPEVIQRIVRQNFGRFRVCYETALRVDPNLEGRIAISFVIQADGSVGGVSAASELADRDFVSCVARQFNTLSFPQPEGGIVRVTYPILFNPGGVPAASAGSADSASAAPSAPPTEPEPTSSSGPTGATPSDAPTPAPMTASTPAPAAPPPVAPLSAEAMPIVELAREVSLDAHPIGAAADPLLAAGKVIRLDALFEALKTRRTSAPASDGGPRVAGLRVAADVPLLLTKSAFQTLALAGYTTIVVQPAWSPEVTIPFAAQAAPPTEADAAAPSARLHVRPERGELVLSWRRGTTSTAGPTGVPDSPASLVSEERIATNASDLAQKLCEGWRRFGSHSDPADGTRDELVLHGDNQAPLASLLPVAAAADTCTRPVAGGASVPAFFLTFSVL